MKFLPTSVEGKNLMPLNFQYVDDPATGDDVLYVVYRDLDDDRKYVHTIHKPKIEVYIVKPEYRGVDHIAPKNRVRDFIELKYLEKVSVRYRTRRYEVAKLLNISKDEVMSSTYVLGIDVKIETFYFSQFKLEYGNESQKIPHIAFGDIETEIKYAPYAGIAPAGEVPISLITVIDSNLKKSYTLALYFPEYGGIDKFWEDSSLSEFKRELHESFDATYGEIDYELMLFNDEVELLKAFWNTVKIIDPDFLEFWNMAFDMSNILARSAKLGYDPGELAWDESCYDRSWVNFYEDKNKIIHKRKHTCTLPIKSLVVDQMLFYAVIRSAGSKIPDFKLNTIADRELKDKKVEYAEDYGSIADFPYKDYRRFVKYNIKDVLLQYGIESKTRDTIDVYGRMYDFCVLPNDIATTTVIVANHYRAELLKMGRVMHNNRNKMDELNTEVSMSYDEAYDEDTEASDEDVIENLNEEETLVDENGKKIKFDGAIVLNPTRMSSTGFDGMKFIHNNVIDEDIGAEYPTSIQITNLSNETFVGKVTLDEPFEMPMYNYNFADKTEEALYKNNACAVALETFAAGDILVGAETFLGMPGVDEVLSMLDMSKILKKRSD